MTSFGRAAAHRPGPVLEERDLLLRRIATLYWVEGLTQSEIAERLSFGRVSVSRMLDEARSRGVVRISVGPPEDRVAPLERELARLFPLSEVRVAVSLPRGATADEARMGRVAARLLAERLPADAILAVASSRSVLPTAEAIGRLADGVRVVEALGYHSRSAPERSAAAVLAAGTAFTPLPAPFVTRSAARAEQARRRPAVRDALTLARRSDAALIGLGSTAHFDGTGAVAPVSEELLERARTDGAVGHVVGQFFDGAGRPVPSALDELRVGLTLKELRAIPLRILVAHGSAKVEAITAAMTGGIASVLVTDEATARELLRRRR
ncbi:hypothetical protein C5C18_13370 [Rathayibacter tritici]|uniref:Sugar-binding domain-containing protein n=1 Tax=Rathayibacter tritici TaxID=33888 RepID=A0A160KV79_9MICO|nr:sugar-binding domain-containing protein [Rathayibacter tritici]AND17836.1 hypothetical protein A6122_2725 [Rathayibacter tritici]PPF62135.1 hypothetical protein C5C21_14530 [Rathayibacter tritici]PPG04576.1 hypothetical protein C5C18_13370 [Rathayibacter tritici]PPI47179.1 hypothetical protein C5D18_04440 [Rathayibacter tritici]